MGDYPDFVEWPDLAEFRRVLAAMIAKLPKETPK